MKWLGGGRSARSIFEWRINSTSSEILNLHLRASNDSVVEKVKPGGSGRFFLGFFLLGAHFESPAPLPIKISNSHFATSGSKNQSSGSNFTSVGLPVSSNGESWRVGTPISKGFATPLPPHFIGFSEIYYFPTETLRTSCRSNWIIQIVGCIWICWVGSIKISRTRWLVRFRRLGTLRISARTSKQHTYPRIGARRRFKKKTGELEEFAE